MSKFHKYIRSVIIAAISLVMIGQYPAMALQGKYDPGFFSSNDIVIYDPEFKCHSGNNSLGDPGESDGKVDNEKNAEIVLRYFTAKGLSLASASGFVGNMTQESTLNPRKRQGGAIAPVNFTPVDGEGFGLVQWTFTSRQKPLVALAKSTKRNTTDIDLQLDYIWKELNEGYKGTLTALVTAEKNGSISPKKAAIIVHGRTAPFANDPDFADAPKLGYEASGDSNKKKFIDDRIVPAESAYSKFRDSIADGTGLKIDGSGSASLSTSNGTECGSLNGDAFTVDGMAFPLISTEELIKGGSKIGNGRGVWCYKAASNCHHDYNAADIMAPPGTVVVAATDGEVVSVRVGASGARCDRRDTITIKSSIDEGIWFYTHLKSGSSVVKNGQKVTAGTKLAVVGPSGAADCTAPHLHIDKLPKPAQFRISCASAGCASKPFVDIQPQLKKLYDQMVAAQSAGST